MSEDESVNLTPRRYEPPYGDIMFLTLYEALDVMEPEEARHEATRCRMEFDGITISIYPDADGIFRVYHAARRNVVDLHGLEKLLQAMQAVYDPADPKSAAAILEQFIRRLDTDENHARGVRWTFNSRPLPGTLHFMIGKISDLPKRIFDNLYITGVPTDDS